jgi:hypothetical protein
MERLPEEHLKIMLKSPRQVNQLIINCLYIFREVFQPHWL